MIPTPNTACEMAVFFFEIKFFKVKNIHTFTTMEQNEKPLKPLKVDHTKLITQSRYAQKEGMSKQRVHAMIKAGNLDFLEIEGATLVIQK